MIEFLAQRHTSFIQAVNSNNPATRTLGAKYIAQGFVEPELAGGRLDQVGMTPSVRLVQHIVDTQAARQGINLDNINNAGKAAIYKNVARFIHHAF